VKTIDINNHFTSLDRSILDGENAYTDYFNYTKNALDILLSSFNRMSSHNPLEVVVLKKFAQKFLNTIEAFRLKYSFDENQSLLVDLTESGFPNFLEYKKLWDDLHKRESMLERFPEAEAIKRNILDHLMKSHSEPTSHLRQLSQRCYFNSLSQKKLFFEFTPGKIELLKEHKDKIETRTYFYSWASFDSVTNKPYVYTMVFDNPTNLGKTDTDIKRDLDFIEVIKRCSHNSSPLKVIASDIDNAYENIYPKILKRIEIGPIYGKYSQDKHPFTLLLKNNFSEEDFLITYQTEIVFSVGQKRTSSFLSKGELRQVFHVDESNKECMDKMISQLDKYLITSHRVLQYINDTQPQILKDLTVPAFIYN
jgi:hypothetical protein